MVQPCGYSNLEEGGWVEAVTTQSAQGQATPCSKSMKSFADAQKMSPPEQLHSWMACR